MSKSVLEKLGLTADDVKAINDADQIRREWDSRLKAVDAIIAANDGEWTTLTAEDAETVKAHQADVNLMGERFEQIMEANGYKATFEKIGSYLAADPTGKGGDWLATLAATAKAAGVRAGDQDPGQLFVESDAYKSLIEGGQKGIDFEIPAGLLIPHYGKGYGLGGSKATLGTDSSLADVDTQYAPQAIRLPGIVDALLAPTSVSSIIPQLTTSQNAVPYMVETVNAEGAVETAEGALAGEASLSFAEASSPVKRIVVGLPVTYEGIEDVGMLRSHINARLPQFIRNREDLQFMSGDGVGQNLTGILNTAGIQTVTHSVAGSDTIVDSFFRAQSRVVEAFSIPTHNVMRQRTWEFIRLTKTQDGIYLFGSPADTAPPRLWGLPVVINERSLAQFTNLAGNGDVGLVGAFTAGEIAAWRRTGVEVSVSDSHSDLFFRDTWAIKARTRVALTVFRPAAFCQITTAA